MSEIKIFKQEIEDGLGDQVKSQASVAYCSPASVLPAGLDDGKRPPFSPELDKILADSNPDQIDLYYLESVLVSTGWNKNDDVFQPSITWAARNTPEDKQFNFMHDENDIIGHITGSYVVGENGEKLEANGITYSDEYHPRKKFDIITQAVLYNSWGSPENRDRMQQIIAEIEEGKWFVSMECLFAGFDYALVDPQGDSKLVERNETSAFLTKHLRSYGGTGKYEGYKVGRSLRDISFSGKGLVSRPANPRSIILNSSKAFHVQEDDILTKFSIGDVQMSDNLTLLDKQVANLQADLATAKEENRAMKQNIEEAKDKEFAATVEAFETKASEQSGTIAELEETIKAHLTTIVELEDTLASKAEELSKAAQSLAEVIQREKQQRRLASLIEAGFDETEAEESLSLYDALEDEAFDAIVANWFDKKKKDDEKDDKKDDKKGDKKDKEAKATKVEETEEAEAEVETSEEIFDEVESTEATLVEAAQEEDELQSTRANLAEWLSENVLKTSK